MKLLLRDLIRFLVVALIFLAVWVAVYIIGYRYNLTTSIPEGLYRVQALQGMPKRGEIVWFCPPDTPIFRKARDEWKDIPPGDCPGNYMHMFKPVVGLPGDMVSVTAQGVWVNGRMISNSRPLTDLPGRRVLQPMLGTYRVKSGTVWLVSHFNARSFDSRYFGSVSARQIQGVARPVWIVK